MMVYPAGSPYRGDPARYIIILETAYIVHFWLLVAVNPTPNTGLRRETKMSYRGTSLIRNRPPPLALGIC
jgi:hypothetical protein